MKSTFILLCALAACQCASAQGDDIVRQLTEFYKKADYGCYETLIQNDIDEFDQWVEDSLLRVWNKPFTFGGVLFEKNPISPPFSASHIRLSDERKCFFLAISFVNMENYTHEDNIYDHIVIDSLRTFVVACLDEEDNIKGFTDISEVGSYEDIGPNYITFFGVSKRRQKRYLRAYKEMIRNVSRYEPEAFLYHCGFGPELLYIKDGQIYEYNCWNGHSTELRERVLQFDLSFLRGLMGGNRTWGRATCAGDGHLICLKTGHTPPQMVRMCAGD